MQGTNIMAIEYANWILRIAGGSFGAQPYPKPQSAEEKPTGKT